MFNSLSYLLVVLLAFVLVYLPLSIKKRNASLLILSIALYAYIQIIGALILVITILLIYFFQERKKFIPITFSLMSLVLTKIFLPNESVVGLSFYSLSALSYVFDLSSKKIKREDSILTLGLYIAFFPQLLAGPIEKSEKMFNQFNSRIEFDYQSFKYGALLFLWGFYKKFAIADRLSFYTKTMLNGNYTHTTIELIVMIPLQYYADFSGYSDMARGIAKMLGIDIMANFKSPFFSNSPREFWTRWHISLMNWLRDYVFFPLILRTKAKERDVFLVSVVTFLLSGLWHGFKLNYAIWGLLFGIVIGINHLKFWNMFKDKKGYWKWVSTPITFIHFSMIGVFLFAPEKVFVQAWYKEVFKFDNLFRAHDYSWISGPEYMALIISAMVLLVFDYFNQKTSVIEIILKQKTLFRWINYAVILIGLFALSFNEEGKINFLYFNF